MELFVSLSILIYILLAGLAYLASVVIHRKQTGKLQLPPGPPGWPIVGNLLQLGPLPHRTMAAWCQEYGPLVFCRIGSTPTVTASSPQMIKELLFNQDETFASRPRTTAAKIMAYDDQNVGLAPYGPHWKLMRRICVEHLLTTRRMEGFQQHRAEEASELVQTMLKEATNGRTIHMREHLGSYTMNVVTRMLIGKRYFGASSMGEKEASDFRELIHASIVLLGLFYVPDHIPLLKWMDPNGHKRLFTTMGKRFNEYYSSIVEEHKQRQLRGETKDGPKDFVDVLLTLSGDNNNELRLNDTEIKALIQDMVVGGTDTASFTMEWFMAEMIRNPKVQRKVQAELDEVLSKKPDNKHILEESDLAGLHYLKAAVKEIFRLHPVGGFLIPHESIRDAKVAGYHVPKGTLVLINTHGLGRNPAVWDRVDEFLPERFLDTNKVNLRDSEFRVIPFGSGKRQCPGAQLGQSMMLLGLGRLLHGFNWSPPPGMSTEDIDVMEAYGLTTPPRTPLKAFATTRLQHSLY